MTQFIDVSYTTTVIESSCTFDLALGLTSAGVWTGKLQPGTHIAWVAAPYMLNDCYHHGKIDTERCARCLHDILTLRRRTW